MSKSITLNNPEFIPFNRAQMVGREPEYIQESLINGHISGDGAFTKRWHALLEQSLGVPKVLLTTSCTHALEMAALLIDLKPGDEVLVPSFTFVSSINAFVLRGAVPVFVDIREDTLNIDERLVEAKITERTRAIVIVHYAGVGAEMDILCDIAQRRHLTLIEDTAHALYGRYKGENLGTFGAMSTLSFHETKNFTCGEGGALLINDQSLIERAEIIREKGTNRSRFFRGQVDKYTWVDVGSSYLPSDMLAAYLYAQLEQREAIQAKRAHIWHYYHTHLSGWAAEQNIRLPFIPAHCEQTYHMFYIVLPSLALRQGLIEHLKSQNILAVFHYLPLHLSPMGMQFGGKRGDCPVTEAISDRLLRLPFFNELTLAQLERIVIAIKSFDVAPGILTESTITRV